MSVPSAAPRLNAFGTVGIGARHEDDVDPVEHAGEPSVGELLGDDDQRLAAGRLVAVLAGDDDDRRPARRRAPDAAGAPAAARTREGKRLDRSPGLRDCRGSAP